MKRLKNLIIPILCVTVFLLFAGGPLKEANAKTMKQSAVTVSTDKSSRINQHEAIIIDILTSKISGDTDGNGKYEDFLLQYFGLSNINLGGAAEEEVNAKATELIHLMNLENKTNMKELSADSKEIAIGLAKDIFTACGLKAGYNPSGDLISLSDKYRNITIVNGKVAGEHINMGVLVISVSVVSILLAICYVLSKKIQIKIKDVKYDGFHKEEFAR
jgi:hypothetical protein